jgi:hypothetical protein
MPVSFLRFEHTISVCGCPHGTARGINRMGTWIEIIFIVRAGIYTTVITNYNSAQISKANGNGMYFSPSCFRNVGVA